MITTVDFSIISILCICLHTQAIKSGKVSEVDAWIQSKGGDVKTIIYKGKYTALHLAAKANSLELITKLLPAGGIVCDLYTSYLYSCLILLYMTHANGTVTLFICGKG